jgi:hypothetical protein
MAGPLREGYGEAEPVDGDLGAHALRISASATVADLVGDYAIFNHGAFFVHGRLDVDPVADYVAKHPGHGCKAMPVTFPRRIFRGLTRFGRQAGPPFAWESTLVFVEREYWPGLETHLRCCAWVDRRRGTYCRAVAQSIPIVDFLAADRASIVTSPVPTVAVTVFGVDGTDVHVQFSPRVAGPWDVPTVVHLPLVAGTRAVASALLGRDPRPFRSLESEGPHADH